MSANPTPELYWISGSPPSWRVMLGLMLKGIPFVSRRLDHGAGENRTDAYLAINPKGQVPTLVHGTLNLRESIAILAYLDRAWPERPLFGETAALAAAIWQDVMVFEADLRPAATVIASTLLRNSARDRAEELAAAIGAFLQALDDIAVRLDSAEFLGPGGPSASDCWLFPTLAWIDRALAVTKETPPDALRNHTADRPALARWRGRFEALRGVPDTFPPHWAETPAP